MVERLAQIITYKFIEKSVIREENRDVYICGCGILVSEFISTCILFIIGICMGIFFETILYLLVFTCIRINAGGYHAGSYNRCISIFSICAFILFVLVEWIIRMKMFHYLILAMIFADIIIFALAPVEDLNKRLSYQENIKFRKSSIIICSTITVISIIIYNVLPHWRGVASYAMIAVCENAMLLIAGNFKNRILLGKSTIKAEKAV